MIRGKIVVFTFLAMAVTAVFAEEYTIQQGACLSIPDAGVTFAPGGALPGWKSPFSPKGRVRESAPGAYAFRMFAGPMLPTGEPAPETVVFDGTMCATNLSNGSLEIAYTIVPDRDVALEAFHLAASLDSFANGGGFVSGDGKEPVRMPETMRKDAHFFVRTVKELAIEGKDGRSRIAIALPKPCPVTIQDNRKWGQWDFSLRIPIAASPLKGGREYAFRFTLSGRTPLVRSETDGRYVVTAGDDWVPLVEDGDIVAGSALDFSSIRDTGKPAGRYGRIRAVGDHFEFEKLPGIRQRFLGVNICMRANVPEVEVARRFAANLARLGYNAARFCEHEPFLLAEDGVTLDVDKMARFDAFVAACIENGIYVMTDLFMSRQSVPYRLLGIDRDGKVPINDYKELVLFHDGAFEDLKSWARTFLAHVNPHTGRSLAEEPAVAFISFVNEGALGGRGMAQMKKYPEALACWRAWLAEKKRQAPEKFAAVTDTLPSSVNDRESVHQAAFALFMSELEARFYRRMSRFLRDELKSKALFTDMNGWHFPSSHMLVRADEYDFADDHYYNGHPQWLETPWKLPARCRAPNPLKEPNQGIWSLAQRRVLGKPFSVSEFGYPPPARFRGVAGLLAGAQAALQDWSALYHFAWSHDALGLEAPETKRMDFFNICADPLAVAADRAMTCLFLRGDIAPLQETYAISLDRTKISDPRDGWFWHTVPWLWAGWYAKIGYTTKDSLPGATWTVPYPDAYARTSERVRQDIMGSGIRRAGDGAVSVDSVRGTLTVSTPRTVGGFAEEGEVVADGFTVRIAGHAASVWASSLDDRPIGASERLLVTHLTDLQNTNQTYADQRSTILLDWGTVPHLARAGMAEIAVAMPTGEWMVWALSTAGRRLREVPSRFTEGRLRFTADVAADRKAATFLYEIVRRTASDATVTADFAHETGHLNRNLHGAGFTPRFYGSSIRDDSEAIRAMRLTATRTHDWALNNPGQRMCDTHFIFPLMKLDPADPSNYFFGPTDEILRRARAIGLDVLYRIGTSIEHTGDTHFNILVPEDFAKYAEVAAGIVRHYNRGWANGHEWDIRRWEIWNEPDGLKFCWGGSDKDPVGMRRKFIEFFITVLKRLKSEFPEIEVGGPAFTWWADDYAAELLAACKAAGAKPDFISWHCYTDKPELILEMPRKARRLCDAAGFPETKLFLDEWHYIKDWIEFLGFDNGKNRKPVPGKSDKAFLGPSGHLNIDSAAYALYVLAKMQDTPLDRAYYYGCGYDGLWGFADPRNRATFNKTYYAMVMHGELISGYTRRVAVVSSSPSVGALGALSEDGRRGCLLVADYRGSSDSLSVDIAGADGLGKVKAVILDDTCNLEEIPVSMSGGRLTLPKRGYGSAAFLLRFDVPVRHHFP